MDRKLKVVLVGAGNRGENYTNIMAQMSDRFEVIAVAEPIDSRRNAIKQKHNLPDEMCFTNWDDLFALGKIADLVLITTMDRQHFEPAMKAISLKYDVLFDDIASTSSFVKSSPFMYTMFIEG